ncbi:MAG: helix-turn-helix domain-containing protein [Lachnospiraceae bacterium]
MNNNVGNLLKQVRVSKHIKLKQLSSGLCHLSLLCRYEKGELLPDFLMLQALMQRLGIPLERLSVTLSRNEYNYMEWRREVVAACNIEAWNLVEQLLKDGKKQCTSFNKKLQQQFILFVRGLLETKNLSYMQQAIAMTVKENASLFTCDEIEMILTLSRCEMMNGKVGSVERIRKMIHFMEDNMNSDMVSVYGKAIYILCKHVSMEREERFLLCSKAYNRLITYNKSSYLLPIITLILKDVHDLGKEDSAYKEVYRILYDVQQDKLNLSMCPVKVRALYLIHELIRKKRKGIQLSQEQLSDQICAVETLSRMEGGKHTPSIRKYEALSKKLSLQQQYVFEVETEQMDALKLAWSVSTAVRLRDYFDLSGKIEALADKLDTNIVTNEQYILLSRIEEGFLSDRFRACELLAQCRKGLTRTIGDFHNALSDKILNSEEVKLFLYLAIGHRMEGDFEKALEILHGLYVVYKSSNVKMEYHEAVELLYIQLSKTLFLKKEFGQALVLAEEGICHCLKRECLFSLIQLYQLREACKEQLEKYSVKINQ